jgi:hypothetical protein
MLEKIHDPQALWLSPLRMDSSALDFVGTKRFLMTTNCDFSRSSLLTEQYQREMELIAAALQEESQDEREERLGLVERSWSLTCTCFHGQLESTDAPVHAPVAVARL